MPDSFGNFSVCDLDILLSSSRFFKILLIVLTLGCGVLFFRSHAGSRRDIQEFWAKGMTLHGTMVSQSPPFPLPYRRSTRTNSVLAIFLLKGPLHFHKVESGPTLCCIVNTLFVKRSSHTLVHTL